MTARQWSGRSVPDLDPWILVRQIKGTDLFPEAAALNWPLWSQASGSQVYRSGFAFLESTSLTHGPARKSPRGKHAAISPVDLSDVIQPTEPARSAPPPACESQAMSREESSQARAPS